MPFRKQLVACIEKMEPERLLQEPPMPIEAVNRVDDNWMPLFQIAALAGQLWTEKITDAFNELEVQRKQFGAIPTSSDLMADIREVLQGYIGPEIPSSELLQKLLELPEGDWSRANSGREITSKWLVAKLRPYGIVPRRRARGNVYLLPDLTDAFSRYLPSL